MVKNAKGGNKSKGFARKFISSQQNTSIRLPQDPLEQFAIVQKMYGTICDVTTQDMKVFKCHIRGKFRGRSKRNSIISVGKLILIGFRDFEAPQYKNTDLLEIYDSQDILLLSLFPQLNISSLLSLSQSLLSTNYNTTTTLPTDDDDSDIISFSNLPTTTLHPTLQHIPLSIDNDSIIIDDI
jgi:hypothetical protein